MNSSTILDITRQGLTLILLISLPVVLVAAVSALIVAVAQAVTQVQDQTISFSVRAIAVMVTILLMSGWGAGEILRFAQQALQQVMSIT
ncbi:EscS/YscS/HrcS family type III secretion system export apparatus protein [Pandoraea thiooxydans]|uniref:Type III secretion protein HrpO n=1 Tax=Pandoraea thiooxydans TaxID=445709 RepID=A0A0G3EYQ5_9BURK|nr:type III secretion system export apparatus subunit SctS [Pandoraea thiooxydans]AKJ70537.1 EscS/YscS/HrcS family type III secretion system export apparatus protein [Pandoraea thiooxydans]